MGPLLGSKRRKGAFQKLKKGAASKDEDVTRSLQACSSWLSQMREEVPALYGLLGENLLDTSPELRVTSTMLEDEAFQTQVEPLVHSLEERLRQTVNKLGALESRLDDVEVPVEEMQPLKDVSRARRRIEQHVERVGWMLQDGGKDWCRWAETTGALGSSARLCVAPIDVSKILNDILWSAMHAVVVTSATLTVGGKFDTYKQRHGLEECLSTSFPSPFEYSKQSVLALPKDLPTPDAPNWQDAIDEQVLEMVRISGGGAFILCTSHAMVGHLGALLSAEFGDSFPVLIQGRRGRERLLQQFKEHRDAVLVGTDSFWEGVSVKGEGLRMVIIPRLPFRVPSHPVAQARYEAAEAMGMDPFRAFSLPEAVIKLRQGFGRLIRSKDDRGAVAILDRRIHERSYGRIFLHSLPPARRLVGPTPSVHSRLRDFFAGESD